MKKMMKLGKIFLLIATVFSYVASPISVLAEEVINNLQKPLVLNFEVSEDGSEYTLSYISADPSDYDDTKEYKIELDTTITYINGYEDTKQKQVTVLGAILNSLNGGSSEITELIDEKYNAEYVIEVSVYDELEELLYSEVIEYETEYSVGLTGWLNDDLTPEKEEETTIGNYNVTEGVYTQKMSILSGGLSPNAEYRVLNKAATDETEAEYSVIMSAEELVQEVFEGTQTDLIGKLAGTYSYTDSITFEEVDTTGEELKVEEVYTYEYNANLVYGTDNNALFSDKYQGKAFFMDEYMVLPAKGFSELDTVITIGELVEGLANTDITLEVLDEEGNKLYPEENVSDGIQTIGEEETENSVLDTEVKNGYTVKFTNGATASYAVVVAGDANSDNEFTHDDLVGVIQGYINEENMPSMDVVTSNGANASEEVGTITFEDVIVTNELLKEEPEMDRDEEDNEKLELGFGELSKDVYVGDTIEIDVLLNEKIVEEILEENLENQEEDTGEETNPEEDEEVLEFIEGIDGNVKVSDNLKIKEVKFNEVFTGGYNEEGRVVAVGEAINKDAIVMTLVLEVVSLGEGKANIELSGSTSKYLNINDFEAITTEFDVNRRLSTNNNLSMLSASAGKFDIEFNSEDTIYTLTVSHNTESVELSGTLEDEYAKVEGLGKYELKDSKTAAIITVIAEDGTTKVYTVYIVKEAAPVTRPVVYYYSSNNYLKSLTVDGYELEFDKNTGEYKITVNHDVTSLDISALAEDTRSRVEITGNGDFKEGENVVTITVTAENGSVREYKLVVEKEVKPVASGSSNTAEKIVIIVLIILVVLGLLYLIFKRDEEDMPIRREDPRTKNDNKEEKNTTSNKKNNSGNKKKKNNTKNKKK